MTSARWMPAVRYTVPGLLAGLIVSWVLGLGRMPQVQAQGTAPAEANGIIAFTAAGPGSTQLLYLIDTRTQTLAIYQVDPQELKGTLKLEAARQYRWDLRLAQFNNQPPEVSAVEAMIGAAARR